MPGRFHPGWSLLGRELRRLTGDRLRAEAFHVVVFTGGALGGLMGVYAAEVLAEWLALAPLVLWGSLAAAGLLWVAVGFLGFRPPAVVTCGPEAVRIERGRERLRLPYAALARTEVVAPRVYHRHYRPYAAVRPFLGAPGAAVLLLHMQDDITIAALGLSEASRRALLSVLEERRHVEQRAKESANVRGRVMEMEHEWMEHEW